MFRRWIVGEFGAVVSVALIVAVWSGARVLAASVHGGAPMSKPSDADKTDDDKVRSLIARLGSKEPADGGVEYELVIAGSRSVPALIGCLSLEDSWTRSRAAKALGLIGSSTAAPALIAMARRKAERYESALDSLGQIGGPDAADFFLEVLPAEPPEVQARLIGYLGLIGDNRTVPALCEVLAKSSPPGVRRRAAEALGHFRDQRSRNALKIAIDEDRNWDVYMAAKRALLYQMAGKPIIFSFATRVEIVIEKEPEPAEGVEEWLRQYKKAHPPSSLCMPTMGPTVHDFVTRGSYDAARSELIHRAKHPSDAMNIVEVLLGYMRHAKIDSGVGQKAMQLIVEIGDTAVPALENAVKRGDETLKANANACLRKITAAN